MKLFSLAKAFTPGGKVIREEAPLMGLSGRVSFHYPGVNAGARET
jgi:hypothetical protein